MNPRHDTEHLRHTITTLQHILHNYKRWHQTLTQLMADGYPTGSNNNIRSRGSHTDPVATIAIQRHKQTRDLNHAAHLTRQLHQLTDELYKLISTHPIPIDINKLRQAARCSGAIDPTCTNLADGRRHKSGLCDRCWQIQYRQQRAS